MKAVVRWAIVSLFLCIPPASADTAGEERLATALELFNSAAFWSDSNTPNAADEKAIAAVVRWVKPIRAFVGPSATSNLRTIAQDRLREVASIAGIPVEFVDSPDASNFRFVFLQEYQVVANLPSAGCVTQFNAPGFELADVTVNVRINQPSCMLHEMMHAFGFGGHPHQLKTVLSYSYMSGAANELTEADRLILKALYSPKIVPGLFHLPALIEVRQFLAETLGLVPAGGSAAALARPVLDKAVARLRKAGERGDQLVQYQLGIAYLLGHHVVPDPKESIAWLELAAAQKMPAALYIAGLVYLKGEGVPVDAARGDARLRAASELGHPQAAMTLGQLRESEGNRVEAYAYFDLAERRGANGAGKRRDGLSEAMTPDERAKAVQRARELPTAPAG
ncbi:MAG: DUF2927 domain-containing protein [Rhodospirillales bacterium]|nr:DUF2927 domain-containing protein [Rhodospirillales bacterium]